MRLRISEIQSVWTKYFRPIEEDEESEEEEEESEEEESKVYQILQKVPRYLTCANLSPVA